MEIIAVLVAFASIAFGIYQIHLYYEKKRREALRPLADKLRMTFFEKGPADFELHYQHLFLFTKGRSKQMYNLFEGKAGDMSVSIFDYDYTTGSGKSSSTWRQTVVMFDTPRLSLPAFQMEPENFGHKLIELFSSADIDFKDFPGFSANYYLTGANEQEVRALFDAKKLDYFTHVSDLCVEGAGSQLLVYISNKRTEPEHLEATLKNCLDVANVFLG